jgi:hypothetical protein
VLQNEVLSSHMSQGREEPAARRYPYGPWESDPHYNEAQEVLFRSRKDGETYIPTFVQRMLREFTAVGLVRTTEDEPPSNICKVKPGGEQEL